MDKQDNVKLDFVCGELNEFLNRLPEYRRTKCGNFRYKLSDILVMLLISHLAGRSKRTQVIGFVKDNLDEFRKLGILKEGCPSEPTLCRIENNIGEECFAGLYSEFSGKFTSVREDGSLRILAMDGKFMRGTTFANGRHPDIVSLYSVGDGITVRTEMCEEKSNEIKAAPKILEGTVRKGDVVTADAMSCQKDIVKVITEQEADYVIGLKDNQKGLLNEVKDRLGELKPIDVYSPKAALAHGRITERKCSVYSYWGDSSDPKSWSGLKSIVRIQCHTCDKKTEKTSDEERYYISSLSLSAREMDGICRQHWAIENNLHGTLDVQLNQDGTKRKHARAARNFDTLQKTVLTILNVAARKHVPENRGRNESAMAAVRRKASNSLAYAVSLLKM